MTHSMIIRYFSNCDIFECLNSLQDTHGYVMYLSSICESTDNKYF